MSQRLSQNSRNLWISFMQKSNLCQKWCYVNKVMVILCNMIPDDATEAKVLIQSSALNEISFTNTREIG